MLRSPQVKRYTDVDGEGFEPSGSDFAGTCRNQSPPVPLDGEHRWLRCYRPEGGTILPRWLRGQDRSGENVGAWYDVPFPPVMLTPAPLAGVKLLEGIDERRAL